jgi:hypothetical protein
MNEAIEDKPVLRMIALTLAVISSIGNPKSSMSTLARADDFVKFIEGDDEA